MVFKIYKGQSNLLDNWTCELSVKNYSHKDKDLLKIFHRISSEK